MVKFIIARGIGFSPGSSKWMPTLGFSIGAAITPPSTGRPYDIDQLTDLTTIRM